MRRQDREIKDPSIILDIIHSLPFGHLAMNDAGKPYGVTMNYLSELDADRNAMLYFHGAKEGRKAEILARDPHVYFFAERDDGPKVIVRPNGNKSVTNLYVSVAGEGMMELVEDAAEKRRVLLAMANAFSEEPFESLPDAVVEMTAVWKLVLHGVTGKSNPPLTPPE
jgi:nitroimidazol reductase NimA-like FMN-containing flavoprotein (pyridoxamine 5'-phosphate oxidase superfamily)